MSDLPAPIPQPPKYKSPILQPDKRPELLAMVRKAGKYGLNPMQLALLLEIRDDEFQYWVYWDTEAMQAYANARLVAAMDAWNTIYEIANDNDPENKQRFPAAKYIYERLMGVKVKEPSYVVHQLSPHSPAAVPAIGDQVLDVATLEAIRND